MILQCIFSFLSLFNFLHASLRFPAGAWCRAEWKLHKTDASGDFRKDCSADYAASKSQHVLVGEVEGSHGRPLSQQEQNEKPNLCSSSSWSCWIIASCLSLLNFYPSLSCALALSLSLPPFFPSNWLTDTFKDCSECCAKTTYDKWWNGLLFFSYLTKYQRRHEAKPQHESVISFSQVLVINRSSRQAGPYQTGHGVSFNIFSPKWSAFFDQKLVGKILMTSITWHLPPSETFPD